MQRAICLLSWDGDHRDLHSFPTRRSSDLSSPTATRGSPRRRLACASGVAIGQWPLAGAAHPSWSLERSEEHTSELQSPFHLVSPPPPQKKQRAISSRSMECTSYVARVGGR